MSKKSQAAPVKSERIKISGPSGRFWLMISVAIACGLAAGILGETLMRIYAFNDYGSSPFYGELNLSGLNTANSGLVIRDAKKVVVNEDVKITETLAGIRPVLVSVFKKIPDTSSAAGYYNLEDPLFIGLTITSDGWAAAMAPDDIKKDFRSDNYIAIVGNRQVYKIDRVADLQNLPGDPLLFHLEDASNLAVKKNITRSELSLGESLLAVDSLTSVRPVTLTALSRASLVSSSDAVNARLELSGGDDLNNSFVFDLSGDLVALVADDGSIIPAFSFNSYWSGLSQKEQPERPYLGVNYLDLVKIKTSVVAQDKGAWLYPSDARPAVIKGSPAEAAGLRSGDVITWVNNVELDINNDLADILANFKAGDKVTLTYVRAGVEKEMAVKLGGIK